MGNLQLRVHRYVSGCLSSLTCSEQLTEHKPSEMSCCELQHPRCAQTLDSSGSESHLQMQFKGDASEALGGISSHYCLYPVEETSGTGRVLFRDFCLQCKQNSFSSLRQPVRDKKFQSIDPKLILSLCIQNFSFSDFFFILENPEVVWTSRFAWHREDELRKSTWHDFVLDSCLLL